VLFGATITASALEKYTGFYPAARKFTPEAPLSLGNPGNSNMILTSPGRIVGTTYYDMQSNGSTSDGIVVDYYGGVHFVWTQATTSTLDPRNIRYGFIAANGDSLPAIQMPGRSQSGFAGIDLLRGTINPSLANAAVVGYHNSEAVDDRFAVDSGRGLGNFGIDSTNFPGISSSCIWPSFSVDINDNIQAVATQSDAYEGELRQHIYTRRAFGSSTWSSPLVFGSSYNISPVITSSPVSAKSAIVWTSPKDHENNQYDNDVTYLESLDGVTWNTGSAVDITNYPAAVHNDTTLRAYTDVDAVYDANDNLHLIWNASYVTRDTANQMVILYHSALFHWSQASGIDLIYDHPVRTWPCDMGAWNLSIAKMSIGTDADSGFIYVTYTRFDPSDYAYFDTVNGDSHPCGGDNAMPCGNGELYMTWSRDSGNSWATPVNITNSATPNCTAGNCDNDNWSSLAERVDDYLHIIYIDDKDAGSVAFGEGDPTLNPVIYLAVANPTRSGGSCNYVVGDINGNGALNGIDVTYGVSYFKGGLVPPYSCNCNGGNWYVAGDVNNSCVFNGIDITYLVSFFKGGPAPVPCHFCPPQ
jgi:hypothetical protein